MEILIELVSGSEQGRFIGVLWSFGLRKKVAFFFFFCFIIRLLQRDFSATLSKLIKVAFSDRVSYYFTQVPLSQALARCISADQRTFSLAQYQNWPVLNSPHMRTFQNTITHRKSYSTQPHHPGLSLLLSARFASDPAVSGMLLRASPKLKTLLHSITTKRIYLRTAE